MPETLETETLAAWLSAHVPGFRGPFQARKYTGGQSNPTYRITAASGVYVLRRKPPGSLLKSAHAIEREFRVQRALARSAVPVAPVLVLCEDKGVIGSAFYVMNEVAGTVYDDPRLPGLSPEQRDHVMDRMNSTLAAIHDVDIAATGLTDYGPQGNYYQRQLDRWSQQYRATKTEELPEMDALMKWLSAHLPKDDGQRCLVHGDYRIDNLLFSEESQECVAVLDWELSTIGHPFADLASVIMQWSMPTGVDGRGLSGVDRVSLGLWSDRRFVETYCARRGLAPVKEFGFFLAFCCFRMAAILQGVKKRALEGNASDPARGLGLAAKVPDFARLGLAQTD